jgi:copper chaperone CopZ
MCLSLRLAQRYKSTQNQNVSCKNCMNTLILKIDLYYADIEVQVQG